MTGSAACTRAGQEQDGLRAVGGIDGLEGQRTLGVKRGQTAAQFLIAERLLERNVVLLKRGAHAVTREHGGALHDSCGTDGVDAHIRSHRNGQFANQVRERGLAYVVGLASLLGNDGVG